MTGNRPARVILQPRDRLVLQLLGSMRVATWQQLAQLSGFRSRTRISSRLALLSRAGHIRRTSLGTIAGGRRVIYSLPTHRLPAMRGPAGTEAAIAHQLLVNDVRVLCVSSALEGPSWSWWQPEPLLDGSLEPDGAIILESQPRRCFLIEIDRGTEGARVWRRKVERYIGLASSGQLAEKAAIPRFGVIVVSESQRRTRHLKRMICEQTHKLFWLTTINQLTKQGLLAPIWLRPDGDEETFLIKENNEILPNM